MNKHNTVPKGLSELEHSVKNLLEKAKKISNLDLHLANTAVEEWYHMCISIMLQYYSKGEVVNFLKSENLSYNPRLKNNHLNDDALIIIKIVKQSIENILFYNTIQRMSVFTPFLRTSSSPVDSTKSLPLSKPLKRNSVLNKHEFKANFKFDRDFENDKMFSGTKSFSLLKGILGRYAEIGALSVELGGLSSKNRENAKREFIINWAMEMHANGIKFESLRAIAISMRKPKHKKRWDDKKFDVLSEDAIYRILTKSEVKKLVRR